MVLIASLVLVVAGLNAMARLPIDAVPDVTNVQVQILTDSPALGPEEVERFVTTPVEQAMSGLPEVTEVRSTSKFGLSAVTVVFDDGTDIYFARQQIGERLTAARRTSHPGYGEPEMGPVSTGLGEIFQFEVRGDGLASRTAPDGATHHPRVGDRAAPALASRAWSRSTRSAASSRPTRSRCVPPTSRASTCPLDDVAALEQNNANAGGAYLEHNGEQYLVRGEGLQSRADIGDVVVATTTPGRRSTSATWLTSRSRRWSARAR
jgi:cobalt-zinc-cadmium resistance protein CzcA